jgi:hypothetical protein
MGALHGPSGAIEAHSIGNALENRELDRPDHTLEKCFESLMPQLQPKSLKLFYVQVFLTRVSS